MRTGPMITELSAKRSRRHLANNANNYYNFLKKTAHRRERKNNKIQQLDNGNYEMPQPTKRLTKWDIS